MNRIIHTQNNHVMSVMKTNEEREIQILDFFLLLLSHILSLSSPSSHRPIPPQTSYSVISAIRGFEQAAEGVARMRVEDFESVPRDGEHQAGRDRRQQTESGHARG